MGGRQVWFITGAGRGMGESFVRAALAAGHAVVATGRRVDEVARVFADEPDVLAVKLDVTRTDDASSAAEAAVERFGRIDLLVNSAGRRSRGSSRKCLPGRSIGSWRRIWWGR